MTRLINGPINVVRLEGKVFGIKKILFVFFEYHASCNLETKCSDIFAENITEYFINQFRNSNKDKMYDFFLETFPSRLRIFNTNLHGTYLFELKNLMAKVITYEKKTNRVSSKIFPNIRLHYIDVRDYLYERFYYQMFNLISICREMYINSILAFNLTLEDINYFDNQVQNFYENIYTVYDTFFPKQKGGRIIEPDITPDTVADIFTNNQKYLIDKIKNRYTHTEIKTAINKILDEKFRKNLEEILDKILELRDPIDRLKAIYNVQPDQLNQNNNTDIDYGPDKIDGVAILADIYSLINKTNDISMPAGSILMDVYFLRRFLDKDYITNGISYTGYDHSLNYIDILVKTFDFKITHASYSKYDIPQLNEKIHESGIELSHLFLPLQLQQCSDVSSFPLGFD